MNKNQNNSLKTHDDAKKRQMACIKLWNKKIKEADENFEKLCSQEQIKLANKIAKLEKKKYYGIITYIQKKVGLSKQRIYQILLKNNLIKK